MKRFLWWAITGFLAAGLMVTVWLVYNEVTVQGVCPDVLSIPACYVILGCFAVALAAHLADRFQVFYFFATGLAVAIAIYASISQFLGTLECPKTIGGIPLCYVSLGLFTSVIVAKIWTLATAEPDSGEDSPRTRG